MDYGIYFSRSFWIVVPEVLYLILLFGSVVAGVIFAIIAIKCLVSGKEEKIIIKWVVSLLIAVAVVVMCLTGKITPNTAFGG